MDTINYIRSSIKKLYETAPNIHVSINRTHPKIVIEASPAKIIGVHKNIFRIEENDNGRPVQHTLQYGDVLIGHVTIKELNLIPLINIINTKQQG